jgi:hypothetical protein
MRAIAKLGAALLVVACSGRARTGAPAASASVVAPANLALRDDAGKDESIEARAARSPHTVLVFFSSECPVQKAHDARLRELMNAYQARGVAFAAVVSEVGVDMAAEREEAKRRVPGIAVLEDKNAALADALGVEYSTHSVLLDKERHVLYSGGIDSDRTHLSPDTSPWLKQALDATLSGAPVAKAKTEPLGCPLRKH